MTSDSNIKDLVLVDFDDRGEAGRVARVTFNNPEKGTHSASGANSVS